MMQHAIKLLDFKGEIIINSFFSLDLTPSNALCTKQPHQAINKRIVGLVLCFSLFVTKSKQTKSTKNKVV